MKDSDFELLVTSVKQAGRIRRGELAPVCKFEVRPDAKTIRAKPSLLNTNCGHKPRRR